MTEKKRYRVLRGLNWPDNRAEPGQIRDDIPPKSVDWLLKDGAIEVYEPKKKGDN